MASGEARPLHMLFFPLMAAGHMLPMANMARIFAARGVKATILTTPANAPLIRPSLDRANRSNQYPHPITLLLVPFPSAAVGLPDGCENLSSIPSPDLHENFYRGTEMLRQPFDQVLRDHLPDCVVTDGIFPWTLDVAAEHGIPRLTFHGTGFFTLCCGATLDFHMSPDSSFVIAGLPHRIEMLWSHMIDLEKFPPGIAEILRRMEESDGRSYGQVVNSFYELEPDYVNHYRKVVGRRAWHVGPVALCNKDGDDMSDRGSKASVESESYMKWLDSKASGSVVYVCFGSKSEIPTAQLRELAIGLESSGHPFMWVVRECGHEWVPEGFEERMKGKGLLIRRWCPQIFVLNHRAVGGFLTHCGWNSCLEGVTAGVPMATWPLGSDQFYNERLMVDVLGIGVSIGVKEPGERSIVATEVERAVKEVMGGGEKAEGRRRRVVELGEMARKAVEDGGTSSVNIENLIRELTGMGQS